MATKTRRERGWHVPEVAWIAYQLRRSRAHERREPRHGGLPINVSIFCGEANLWISWYPSGDRVSPREVRGQKILARAHGVIDEETNLAELARELQAQLERPIGRKAQAG